MPATTPTPVRTETLSPAQLAGEQCVWCRASTLLPGALRPGKRQHVGWCGRPLVKLYGCQQCIALGRRLPVWPEAGAC